MATVVTSSRDVVIILAAFGVLAGLGVFIVQHYTAASDATTVLGVIIPAISTIAGTAFGVVTGAKAGAVAGSATAQAAQTETQAVRTQAQQALTGVADLRSELEPVMKAAATTDTSLSGDQIQGARTKLDTVERSLRGTL